MSTAKDIALTIDGWTSCAAAQVQFFADNLALLFRKLLSKEFIPQSWLISRLVPIPKGEGNYRPIAVGEAFLTILSEAVHID